MIPSKFSVSSSVSSSSPSTTNSSFGTEIEDDSNYPLWRYVTKMEKTKKGGNVKF